VVIRRSTFITLLVELFNVYLLYNGVMHDLFMVNFLSENSSMVNCSVVKFLALNCSVVS
jgi:hypothetical protein